LSQSFPSDLNPGHHVELKTVWQKTLRRAKVPYFRIYDLRSTYGTRLNVGGVADEWVTQLLRQGDIDHTEDHPLAVELDFRLAHALEFHHVFKSEGMFALTDGGNGE
jgi:integrase